MAVGCSRKFYVLHVLFISRLSDCVSNYTAYSGLFLLLFSSLPAAPDTVPLQPTSSTRVTVDFIERVVRTMPNIQPKDKLNKKKKKIYAKNKGLEQ